MARGVDFQRLYHEFGLEPDASVDDLKLAYRRRVSALHPDRMATDPISQHLAGEHLTRLTVLYDAALRFHQQHGRLPGATTAARGEIARSSPTRAASTHDATVPGGGDEPAQGHVRWWVLGMLVIGLLVWTISRLAELEDAIAPEPAPAPAVHARATTDAAASPRTPGIRLGMRADDVLHVQGAPVARTDERWDYGPSWIRFDKGRVVEWYSSPLRALRIDRSPVAVDAEDDGTQD